MTGPGIDVEDGVWPAGGNWPELVSVAQRPTFCTFPIEAYPKDKSMTDNKPQRVDPSVKESELELKGEPFGSVPMAVTIGKPQAYYPPKREPK